jgi:hypothetical protein
LRIGGDLIGNDANALLMLDAETHFTALAIEAAGEFPANASGLSA